MPCVQSGPRTKEWLVFADRLHNPMMPIRNVPDRKCDDNTLPVDPPVA